MPRRWPWTAPRGCVGRPGRGNPGVLRRSVHAAWRRCASRDSGCLYRRYSAAPAPAPRRGTTLPVRAAIPGDSGGSWGRPGRMTVGAERRRPGAETRVAMAPGGRLTVVPREAGPVVVCLDKFRGWLTAVATGAALAAGLRGVDATFAVRGTTAVVELAQASGLALVGDRPPTAPPCGHSTRLDLGGLDPRLATCTVILASDIDIPARRIRRGGGVRAAEGRRPAPPHRVRGRVGRRLAEEWFGARRAEPPGGRSPRQPCRAARGPVSSHGREPRAATGGRRPRGGVGAEAISRAGRSRPAGRAAGAVGRPRRPQAPPAADPRRRPRRAAAAGRLPPRLRSQ